MPVNSDTNFEDADAKSKKKKARTTFTGRQIFELEKQFEMKKYLSSSERSEMAKLLNVTETQVRSPFFTGFELFKSSDPGAESTLSGHFCTLR